MENRTISLEEYKKYISSALEEHSADLISALKEVLGKKFNPEVERVDFEVHQNSNEVSIMLHSMSNDLNEVFNEDGESNLFAGSKKVVDKINYFPNSEIFNFDTFYDQYDKDADKTYINAIVEWFGRCWDQADGLNFELPSYIQRHDSGFYFYLKDKKWIKQ